MMITKVCKFCNKQFECSRSTPNRVFCSSECLKAFYRNKYEEAYPQKEVQEKRKCQCCGKEFIWSSKKPGQKYCSKKCANEVSNRIKKNVWSESKKCSHCGKMFQWISSKPNQKYCSAECRNAATLVKIKKYNKKRKTIDEQLRNTVYLKVLDIISKMDQTKGNTFGGKYIDYSEIGDISEKTREKVLERDEYRCQVCKRKDSLQLHHLIKRKNGGNHSEENLITLCASCHRHIETGDIEHATTTCFKNAKKYYGGSEDNTTVDFDILKDNLVSLFEKLKESSVSEDSEIMVCLDKALDLIDVD